MMSPARATLLEFAAGCGWRRGEREAASPLCEVVALPARLRARAGPA